MKYAWFHLNNVSRRLAFTVIVALVLVPHARADDSATQTASAELPWRTYVARCLDTLVEHGTDTYGPQTTPLIMAVLDVDTLESPERPEELDSLIRLEGRIHRRGERGSNLWYDQPLLAAMYEMDQRAEGDQYADAADAYIAFYLEHCHKSNGMLAWGSHVHWDCYRDRIGGDGDGSGPHEILINHALWDQMYRINPEVVRREIDLIWERHVHDKEHGRHNRHDAGHPGADFPFSGGSYVEAFAFMHSVTPDDTEYLRRANLVADWHWRHRDPETDIVAFEPGNMLYDRESYEFYGSTFASAVTGPHAARLLDGYQLTGDEHLRDIASSYLKAYNRYGWLEDAQTFVGMLNLDGSITTADQAPEFYHRQLRGAESEPDPEYSVPPIGPVEVWQTTIFPLDFPLMTAQSSVYAYQLSQSNGEGDPELLEMAKRWARLIESELPASPGRVFRNTLAQAMPKVHETGGTYAANYGRAISFFVHLYRATGDKHYLEVAQSIARDAVNKLYVETELQDDAGDTKVWGIFRGHPAKQYYESCDGVGLLLYALLELDEPDGDTRGVL